jgi:hypothetical protein
MAFHWTRSCEAVGVQCDRQQVPRQRDRGKALSPSPLQTSLLWRLTAVLAQVYVMDSEATVQENAVYANNSSGIMSVASRTSLRANKVYANKARGIFYCIASKPPLHLIGGMHYYFCFWFCSSHYSVVWLTGILLDHITDSDTHEITSATLRASNEVFGYPLQSSSPLTSVSYVLLSNELNLLFEMQSFCSISVPQKWARSLRFGRAVPG